MGRRNKISENRAEDEFPTNSDDRDDPSSRSEYNMEYLSSTHIPEHWKVAGFEYRWERTSVRGTFDSALDEAGRRGWKPVPISRDPGRSTDIFNRNELSDKYICVSDVILMERELVLGDLERARNDKLSIDRLESSEAYNFDAKNPTKFSIGKVD